MPGHSRFLRSTAPPRHCLTMKRPHPPCNYSDDAKRIVLALYMPERSKEGGITASAQMISKLDGAPSARVVERWAHVARHPQEAADMGRPPLLSEVEKMVVGGWVLSELQARRSVSLLDVESFVSSSFDILLSHATTSRMLHSLHFASHRVHDTTGTTKRRDEEETIVKWLRELRRDFPDQLFCCMDQCTFWNKGAVLRSYSPIGG